MLAVRVIVIVSIPICEVIDIIGITRWSWDPLEGLMASGSITSVVGAERGWTAAVAVVVIGVVVVVPVIVGRHVDDLVVDIAVVSFPFKMLLFWIEGAL